MGSPADSKESAQEIVPSILPIAGSMVTGMVAVLIISGILVVGSSVKTCVGDGVTGAVQEARIGTTSRNNFVYFILIAF
jgi:hypothetical protein